MVVIPRTAASADSAYLQSPHITISTTIGLIIGCLCLFGLIISYQLLSRKRRSSLKAKRSPASLATRRTLRSSPTPTSPSRCFVSSCFCRAKNPKAAGVSPKKHEALRSLHLPSTQRVALPGARPKPPRQARVNLRLCGAARLSAPRIPLHRRHYTQLSDSPPPSPSKHKKPPAAWISPRSPSYDDIPSTPTSAKSQWTWGGDSSVPLSPPPAYVRGTPVRRVCQVIEETRAMPPAYSRGDRESISGDVDGGDSKAGDEIDLPDVVVNEPPVVRFLNPPATASSDSVFVIADDCESESDSSSVIL